MVEPAVVSPGVTPPPSMLLTAALVCAEAEGGQSGAVVTINARLVHLQGHLYWREACTYKKEYRWPWKRQEAWFPLLPCGSITSSMGREYIWNAKCDKYFGQLDCFSISWNPARFTVSKSDLGNAY